MCGELFVFGIVVQDFHGYTVEAVLQENQMNKVIQVYDENYKLAVIKINLAGNYLVEAKILQQLDHPNILPVSKVFEDPPAIMIPFVHGRTLTEHIDYIAPNFETIRAIFTQLVSAIHHVHYKGYLHCDIKPENILVDYNDKPYIIDFGLARPIVQAKLQKALVGNFACMPPEIKEGKVWTERGDIFGLGSILEILLQHCSDPHNIPIHWKNIKNACISANPTLRPASAEILLANLDNVDFLYTQSNTNNPLSPIDDTPATTEEEVVVSKSLIVAGLCVVVLGLIIGIIMHT